MSAAAQYMLLFYRPEDAWDVLPEEQRKEIYSEFFALVDDLRKKGSYVTGAPLQPIATATTVRVRDDEVVMTDGPFAETKEQLGGFFLIEAGSFEEATAVAARVPSARYGTVEVRPLVPARVAVEAG
jgi:hypothetical protein